jgi:hypothetical protein
VTRGHKEMAVGICKNKEMHERVVVVICKDRGVAVGICKSKEVDEMVTLVICKCKELDGMVVMVIYNHKEVTCDALGGNGRGHLGGRALRGWVVLVNHRDHAYEQPQHQWL